MNFEFRSGAATGFDLGLLKAAEATGYGYGGFVKPGYADSKPELYQRFQLQELEDPNAQHPDKDRANCDASGALIACLLYSTKLQNLEPRTGKGSMQTVNYFTLGSYVHSEDIQKNLLPDPTKTLLINKPAKNCRIIYVSDYDTEGFAQNEELVEHLAQWLAKLLHKNPHLQVMGSGPMEETAPGIEKAVETLFIKVINRVKSLIFVQ